MKTLIPSVKIFYQYGLTEAGVMVSVLRDKDYENAPDSACVGDVVLDRS